LCVNDNDPYQKDLMEMEMPRDAKVMALSSGKCNLVITINNQVYGCGNNENGQLGLGDRRAIVNLPNLG